ncbi:two-component system OmpR family response regulator [Brevundimonas faecalis]|uniref:Two-component system OmpR family response regulator n=2 Tax=Brevundimonas faecalis TaxID=947378 RepID=A0ABV2R6B2_9CAUL
MRMLIIDDDARTRAFVADGLRQQGHTVDEAAEGETGLHMAVEGAYDAVVIDRMMPGLPGLEAVQAMRTAGLKAPVLMLTALGSVDDRVAGLNAGADDYLVKPFAFSELSARLQALVRRPPLADAPMRHQVADLEVDVAAHRATRAGRTLDLTPHEFKLLERLARNAGHAVTRAMLLESLWGFHFDPRANLIDAHVSRLRAKVDRGFDRDLIHTIRGVGYVLKTPE